jgi:hypothetical protein
MHLKINVLKKKKELTSNLNWVASVYANQRCFEHWAMCKAMKMISILGYHRDTCRPE